MDVKAKQRLCYYVVFLLSRCVLAVSPHVNLAVMLLLRAMPSNDETIEDMSVRFAAPDAAIVTVVSYIDTSLPTDGVKRENERQIKTFVVVKRNGKWLIMHDQNTLIGR